MSARIAYRSPDESVAHYPWNVSLGLVTAACGAHHDPSDTFPSYSTPICADCAASPQPECRSGAHGFARVLAVTGRVQVPLCQSCADYHDATALTLFGEALAQLSLDLEAA